MACAPIALVGALLVAGGSPAAALQPPVSFTSVALPTWQTDGVVWSIASAGGTTFAGGRFAGVRPPGSADNVNEQARVNFAAFDSVTGTATACAPTFTHSSLPAQATVRSMAVSPDGATLYVGGYFTHVDGIARQNLVAIDVATCTVLPNFAPNPNGYVHTIKTTASAVWIGGGFVALGPSARKRAAAVDPVGSATPGRVQPWAPAFDKDVLALAFSPDGSAIAAGGRFDTVNGAASHALAVVNPGTGATVRTYDGFIQTGSSVKDLAADATGFYTANEGYGPGVFDGRIAVNWSDLQQRWRDLCLGATQALVVYAGVLYSASHAHDCSLMGEYPDGYRHHLLAQSVDDPRLIGWFPDTNDGLGEKIGPRELALVTAGGEDYLWAGGEFTSVNNVAQQGLTRFGRVDNSAGPSLPTMSLSSIRTGEVRVAWRLSLDNDDPSLTYRIYKDGDPNPISTSTATSWFWQRPQRVLLDPVTPGSVHQYQVTASDGVNVKSSPVASITAATADVPYPNQVLADGASFLWRYDEPSDVLFADVSPASTGGTLRGSASFRAPGALKDDPSRAIVLLAPQTTIFAEKRNPAPAVYSVETWFKTSTTTGGKLIGFGDKQTFESANADRHVYMTNAGKLVFGVGLSNPVTLTTSASYNDSAWHHVVATQNAAGMTLYVDGAVVGANTNGSNVAYAGNWRVGGDSVGSIWPDRPSSLYWRGTLDETAVYPTALTLAQVQAHYAYGQAHPDTTPPTVPTGVAATVTGSSVGLKWTAATDNVAVDSYNVYRSDKTDATAAESTSLGWAPAASTTRTDTGLARGTWYYRVAARDMSGNISDLSPSVQAVVSPPLSLGVMPSQDTYVNQSAATTNYATSASLFSRGTPGGIAYLTFAVPAAPAGRTLSAASLRFRTNTDTANAGSADTHDVRLVPAPVTYTTVTWNTRPTGVGALLGQVPGGTVPNTLYTVPLQQDLLPAAQDVTVSITGNGTDSMWLWASETPSAGNRPTLILTYS